MKPQSDETLMQTYSGHVLDPLTLEVKDICITDIAHSLANQCRYNGHCDPFYSVGQHCIEVCRLLQTQLDAPHEAVRWGLMHDAAETYLMDVPTPFKPNMPAYDAWEIYILERVSQKFGLVWPIPEIVWEADQAVLAGEVGHLMLMGPEAPHWMPDVDCVPVLDAPVCHLRAEQLFLAEWRRVLSTK